MKFEYVGGLLYAELSVFHGSEIIGSEVKLRAMIDTGSAGTAADIDRFQIDPLLPGSQIVGTTGVGGSQDVISQPVAKLSIGGVHVLNYQVQFCDLWDQSQFEAIIGSDLLEMLGAVIDFPEREITFTKDVISTQ